MKEKPAGRRYAQGARARSAEATGQRIIDAFLARLLTQWYDEITLDRVAADAGVTVQTVARRFGGKERLLADAVRALSSRIGEQRAAPGDDLGRTVDNLIVDYQRTGDAVIRLLALGPRYPAVKEVLDFGRGEHRRWAARAFAGPLGKLDTAARERTLDAAVCLVI